MLRSSALYKKLQAQGGRRAAIFTDIDDTLIDREGDLTAITDAKRLYKWALAHDYPILLVSGPQFLTILARLRAGGLPNAEAIVSSVGTEIWLREGKDIWTPDKNYEQFIQDRGFTRDAVVQAAQDALAELNAKYPELRLQFQPEEVEQPFKVSMHFFGTDTMAQAVGQDFQRRFPLFKIVTCKEIHHNATLQPNATVLKHCLDILAANKADAVSYLVEVYDIKGGIKAGDSGNDAAMLLNPDPLLPVVVGGYKTELYDEVAKNLAPLQVSNNLHTLEDGRRIYIEGQQRRAASSIVQAIKSLGAEAA